MWRLVNQPYAILQTYCASINATVPKNFHITVKSPQWVHREENHPLNFVKSAMKSFQSAINSGLQTLTKIALRRLTTNQR